MKNILSILLLFGFIQLQAQNTSNPVRVPQPWSQQLAATAMNLWKDSFSLREGQPARWSYDQGVILKGIEGIWNATGDARYFNYIQKSMDHFVSDNGMIKGYRPDEFNIDHINNGKQLLLLYRVTGREKYKKAADQLREQLKQHPRTSEGGFWHKKIYPYQMWLDGLYMGEPFYAEYAMLFHEDTAFNDITKQFVLMELRSRDPKTGLLYHGWDESKQQKWADKKTGLSPNFWARSLGWYGMALVDALDYFPANHSGRTELINILNRFAKGVTAFQDAKSGLWYDVPDKQTHPKNYKEASASCMLVYTLAKGVRKGYLPASYLPKAKKGYDGIIKEFIEADPNGQVNLKGTVQVSGLGGNPYRDGSFEYYMSEPVIVNDPKGMGAFINCAVEMEMADLQNLGKGKTVLLDYYFNNEWRKDITGSQVRFHYTWDDRANSGFNMLGEVFNRYGVKKGILDSRPTAKSLQKASIYLIVDPDTEKETATPHYMQPQDVAVIKDWVKQGGVLLLMSNDSGNAEFKNFNQLPEAFGIHFNEDSKNRVQRDYYPEGEVMVQPQHVIFSQVQKVFIKEFSSLVVNPPATVVLKKGNDNVAAIAKHGKGMVLAIGDPWLYNEYVDGRRLPPEYENYQAAVDLVKWLIKQSK
ncbi:MAG TPA: glycoside hydrolase family 88 protein [Chitinophagaceae bacterium]|nr:glycoside hydrolase family 88 protein [Chitinophagaceae bacterium]